MIEIIPALMPQNFRDLERNVERISHYVSRIQIDIMDGQFVPAKTWPYVGHKEDFEQILAEEKGLPFWDTIDYEIDLMVQNPEDVLQDWIIAGASRIIIHVESSKNLEEVIKKFRQQFAYSAVEDEKEIELGLALNIDTPMDSVLSYLEDIDFIQFMGIDKIGFQGQQFDENVLDKMRDFHNAHPEVILSIDGGVRLENARLLVDAGAKRLVSGSAIIDNVDVGGAIQQFKDLVL